MKSTPVQENRRWHLRQIMRAVGGNNAVASMLNGVSTSYITIVAGPAPTRNIGDKTAAKIEAAFGLPPGALDLPPPKEPAGTDPYISEISATLANVDDTDKEFVLAIAQWVAARELSPAAPRAGKINLRNLASSITYDQQPTDSPKPKAQNKKIPANKPMSK